MRVLSEGLHEVAGSSWRASSSIWPSAGRGGQLKLQVAASFALGLTVHRVIANLEALYSHG